MTIISDEAEIQAAKRIAPGINRPLANQYLGAEKVLRELHERISTEIRPLFEKEWPKITTSDVEEAKKQGWVTGPSVKTTTSTAEKSKEVNFSVEIPKEETEEKKRGEGDA